MIDLHHDARRAPRSEHNRWVLLAAGLAVCTLLIGLSGCYERVVNARGLGADQYSVSESYQESDSKIDRWIFGPSTGDKQREGSLLDRR